VTPNRHGSAHIEFPDDLEIVLTREFDAPIELVFDVLTKPEHVRNWFAPYGEKVTVCSIDLRVGGDYHIVFVTDDGTECSFRGTYLEVEPPTRTVETWLFDGWPGVEAVESTELREALPPTAVASRWAHAVAVTVAVSSAQVTSVQVTGAKRVPRSTLDSSRLP
jgi:uncharacterized protein YndB with AHSA1/START domain